MISPGKRIVSIWIQDRNEPNSGSSIQRRSDFAHTLVLGSGTWKAERSIMTAIEAMSEMSASGRNLATSTRRWAPLPLLLPRRPEVDD